MTARPVLVRAAVGVIAVASRLAPGWRRDDWRAEWLAEIEHRVQRLARDHRLTWRAQIGLLLRCAGASLHLVWLWKYDWSLDMFLQDVRYGVRRLRRRPAFAAVSVLTLALGIGATTAIFSSVHAILLRPLPYPDPDRLVRVVGVDTRRERKIGNLSVPDAIDFGRYAKTVASVGIHNYGGYFTLTGAGEPERIPRLLVSPGYFHALGATPILGRLFVDDEFRPAPPDAVVISEGLWRRRFGSDRAIVGRTILLNGRPGLVIGVLSGDFRHPDPAIEAAPDVFALLDPDEDRSSRSGRYVRAIARLRSGVSPAQAEDDLKAIAAALAEQYPDSNPGRTVSVQPLAAASAAGLRTPLLLLQGATIAILLIACANLAHLLLASGAGRSDELNVRRALGASRVRIVRQLLTEGLVLAGAGGIAGLAVAWWGMTVLAALTALPALLREHIGLNYAVLGFAAAVTIAAGLLFGAMPAIQGARAADSRLRASSRIAGPGGSRRLRFGLVTAEVALSLTLLTVAALLVRSFWLMTRVDAGFDRQGILSFQLAIPTARYTDDQAARFYERLIERLRGLGRVQSVGAVNILPLSGGYSCDGVQVVGREVSEGSEPCAEARSASADYFSTMGISLVGGRFFTSGDGPKAARVVVINEQMAREFFPGENPIGRRIIYSARQQNDAREIVGMVRDVRHFGLDRAAVAEFYTPLAQPPIYHGMTLVARTDGDPLAFVPLVRAAVRELDQNAPLYNVRSVAEMVSASVAESRLRTTLLAGFAIVALLLAAIGTYGVIAVLVAQRTREIAVRLALGARRADVMRLVLSDGFKPVAVGGVLGLAGGVVAARATSGLLFDVSPTDPAIFTIAAAVMMAAGALAVWTPARRACRVDPAATLRLQ